MSLSKPIISNGYESEHDGDWKAEKLRREQHKQDRKLQEESSHFNNGGLGKLIFEQYMDGSCAHPSWTKLKGLYGNERCDRCGKIQNNDLPF